MGILDVRFKDNKMVCDGTFTDNPDLRKQATSISYLSCNEGEKDYMPNFGQPIHLKLGGVITEEAYIELVKSKLFQIDFEAYNGFTRVKAEE
jgi:hypothetical protein